MWPEKLGHLEYATFPVVYFVPVADEKRFLGLLDDVSWKPRRASTPAGTPVRVRGWGLLPAFANGHAYASTDQSFACAASCPSRQPFLPDGRPRSVVTASLRIGQFARECELFLDKARATLGRLVDKEGKESKERFAKRFQEQWHKWKAFVDGLTALTVGVEIDPATQQLVGELAFVPRSDNDFGGVSTHMGAAEQVQPQEPSRGPWSVPPLSGREEGEQKPVVEMPAHLVPGIQSVVEQKYRAFLKLFPVIFTALQVDGLDCCLVVKDGVPVGLKVPNGRQIDHTFRDILKELPTELKDDYGVEWNHGRHADARIHKVTRVFGENVEAYLGIREDVIFCGGLKAVKESLGEFDKGGGPRPHRRSR